jgi:ATP-dependent DNA helicase RecG
MESALGARGAARPGDLFARALRYLPGVGPRRAELLGRLGLGSVGELLLAAPRRLEDRRRRTAIAGLRAGQTATVAGEVLDVRGRRISGGRHLLEVTVADDSGTLSAIWFNQPYLADRFVPGRRAILTGKADIYRGRARLAAPEHEVLDPADDAAELPDVGRQLACEPSYAELAFGRLVPVYGLTEGLGQRFMRRLVWRALASAAADWPEPFDPGFRRERRLPAVAEALRGLHFPEDPAQAAAARRRFAYEELLVLQLALAQGRRALERLGAARGYPVSAALDARIRARLPFRLTGAQDRAVAEVARDLAATRPMNRLLQGDVGSGKTAVAAYACLAVVAGRGQAAIMAPTEVLAEQHHRTFAKLLAGSRVRIACLSGALSAAERRRLAASIAAGHEDLVIGTHAVIQEQVRFKALGLVVLDEQHKFGVEQRLELARKGPAPHVLVMSATPIPRTLAQAYYADLDLSTLDELPGGARRVVTRVVTARSRAKVWEFVERRLAAGERAYVICPLITESQRSDLAAAETVHRELAGRFGRERVGLLHGRMRPEAKRAAMEHFRSGRTPVLVATTVVEVGLDVPEATVIVVEGAERFGLATLHQLRGRIGRDSARRRAWCICVAGTLARESLSRLKALMATSDGFRLAEEDFRLRGPGEFLGSRQHGLPELRFADLAADTALLEMAKRDAAALLAADPELATSGHRVLRERLARLAERQRRMAGVA